MNQKVSPFVWHYNLSIVLYPSMKKKEEEEIGQYKIRIQLQLSIKRKNEIFMLKIICLLICELQ